MKNGYKSENFRYMRPHLLVEQLDYLVKDPQDPDYLIWRRQTGTVHTQRKAAHGINETGRQNLPGDRRIL